MIKERFNIKDADFIIGIKSIKHKYGYFLNQYRYLNEILEKLNMKNIPPNRNMTPVENKELRKNKI